MNNDNIVDNKFKDTEIFYKDGRIGLGRSPLFNYKVDVAIPKNTLMTAFHVGDGSVGFSFGNGTSNGFIPEIIGIGCNENDAGLYFVAIAGNDESSKTPLIVLDSRNTHKNKLTNRPILGITSGNCNDYLITVDVSGNLNINGNIEANDIILNGVSLLKDLQELHNKLNNLITKKTTINKL
jgi:hypothetical protein